MVSRAGIPPQNFVCADREGHIGWTVAGMIPRRVGFDGSLPTSWADGTHTWEGWLDPEEYPRLVDGDWLATLGDGGYAMGARAKQIRDNLLALQKPGERQMLDLQLDDRALCLERWRELLLEVLSQEETAGNDRRTRFRDLVENTWSGRASIESVAYRLVRAFRHSTFEKVYGWLTAACRQADERFNIYELNQWEGPLWKLVNGEAAPPFGPTVHVMEGSPSGSGGRNHRGARQRRRSLARRSDLGRAKHCFDSTPLEPGGSPSLALAGHAASAAAGRWKHAPGAGPRPRGLRAPGGVTWP